MANYSRRNTNKRSSKQGTSAPVLWMFLGVMLGVSAVVVCYSFYTGAFSLDKMRRFVHEQTANPAEKSRSYLAKADTHSRAQSHSQTHSNPVTNPGNNTKSKTKADAKPHKQEKSPRFEFYTLLPGSEVQIPDESETRSNEKAVRKPERKPHHSKNEYRNKESRNKFDRRSQHREAQYHKSEKQKREARKNSEIKKARVVSLNRPSPTLRSQDSRHATLSLKKMHPEKTQSAQQKPDTILMRGAKPIQVASLKASNVVPASTAAAPASPTPSATTVNAASIQAPSSNSGTEPEMVTYVKTPNNKPNTPISGAQYIIQAGVFQELHPADMLKAKLTLQGFNTRVQKVQAQNGQTYFRVTLGPYTSETLAIREKKRLKKENKIPGILILQRRLD